MNSMMMVMMMMMMETTWPIYIGRLDGPSESKRTTLICFSEIILELVEWDKNFENLWNSFVSHSNETVMCLFQ